MEIIKQYAAENANIIVGNVIDDAMANSIRVTMVATGLTNQSGLENEPADVMKSFVYETEDKSEEHDDETVSENTNEDLLNVFADNSENDIDAMKAQTDDEYDIPSFLRKK